VKKVGEEGKGEEGKGEEGKGEEGKGGGNNGNGGGNNGNNNTNDQWWAKNGSSLNSNQGQVRFALKGHTSNQNMRDALAQIEAKFADPQQRQIELAKAYTQISGEIYTSTVSSLTQNSLRLRSAMYANIQDDFAKSDAATTINKHRHNFALGDYTRPQPVWVTSYTYSGDLKGNNLASTANNSGSGFLMGANGITGANDEDITAGVLLGYEQSNIKINQGRDSKAKADIYTFGAYGASKLKSDLNTALGAADIGVRGGIILSNLKLNTTRHLNIGSISDTAKASLSGLQMQISAEVAGTYHTMLQNNALQNTPYLNLTYVNTSLNSASETGSVFDLDVAKNKTNSLISQVGMRSKFNLPTEMPLSLVTDVSWQHSFNTKQASSNRTFAGQNDVMNIKGIALDGDTVNLGLGLNLQTGKNSALELVYFGEAGSKQSNNSAHFNFKTKF